ncbi:MAG: hypothetical protein BGO59_31845 [Spirosoma sp. 48-14]|nr:MAG: hypothetical protein BGO59_31845 [Spirosoma sp. 48-14]
MVLSGTLTLAQDIGQLSAKNPVVASGSIGLRSYYSNGSQSPLYRANPFGYALAGQVTLTFFNGISLPFSVAYSNRQASYSQPFNQFGLSPTYKGFTLHAGYRNLRFSDYTLNGLTMLGGGLEVQKGWLRAGFFYGRMNRVTFSAEGTPTTFLRTGYAARIGIGTAQNYADLILMQGHDHEQSLPAYAQYGLNPARNTAIGFILNRSLGKHLLLIIDAALSVYTGNINAAKIDSTQLQSLPAVVYKSVAPNISSRGLLAVSATLAYSGTGWGIRTGYQRIDPGFTTMGMYNVNNDLEVFSVAPHLNLLQNKVSINANLRLQRDNLLGDKLRQTQRFLPTATLTYSPTARFGVSANLTYSTFNQTPGIKQTLLTPGQAAAQLMNQANYSIMIMPRYSIIGDDRTHTLMLSAGTNQLVDNSGDADLKANTEYSGLNGLLNYSFSLDRQFLSVDAGVNYFTLTNLNGTTNNLGFNLGATKGFLANKLQTSLNAGYNLGQDLNAINLTASGRMQPNRHHRFGLTVLQNQSAQTGGSVSRNFSEFRGTIDYTYLFLTKR